MRKQITLGLLALSLSFLSASVFAGNVDDCEFLKDKDHPDYAPGLYGLCVAWHNASGAGDQTALDAIAENYFERSGGQTVPGSGGSGTDDDPPFECPCWTVLTETHICDLGYLFDTLTPEGEVGSGLDDVYTGILLFMNSASQFENFGVSPDRSECSYTIGGVGVPSENGAIDLNETNGLICGYEIGVIMDLVVNGRTDGTLVCGG